MSSIAFAVWWGLGMCAISSEKTLRRTGRKPGDGKQMENQQSILWRRFTRYLESADVLVGVRSRISWVRTSLDTSLRRHALLLVVMIQVIPGKCAIGTTANGTTALAVRSRRIIVTTSIEKSIPRNATAWAATLPLPSRWWEEVQLPLLQGDEPPAPPSTPVVHGLSADEV